MASNTQLVEELQLLPDNPNSVTIFPTDETLLPTNKRGDRAEKDIYRLFKNIQQRMTVIWSVNYIMIDGQKRRGEADFMIIHPTYGIHIMEVKNFYPRDLPSRPDFLEKAEKQLRKNHDFIYAYLREKSSILETNLHHLGTALILPNFSRTDKYFEGVPAFFQAYAKRGTDIRQGMKLIAFKEDCDNVAAFEEWLKNIFQTLDMGFSPNVIDDCYRAAREVMINRIQRPITLVEDLSVGEHLEQLTVPQAKYLSSTRDNPTIIISGVAGTGKTILVVIEVLQVLVENQHYKPKVLYIVHHDAFCEYVNKLFEIYYIKDKSDPAIDGKQLMKQIKVTTFENLKKEPRNDLYDMVVVDEAQEILTDWDNLEFIENLRSKESGLLRILYDENQGNLGLCLPTSRTNVYLPEIVRNTCSIALLSTLYISGFVDNNTSVPPYAGRKPEIIYCEENMDILQKCVERLDTLAGELKSKNKPTNVALLTNSKERNIQDLQQYPTYSNMIKKWDLAKSTIDYARKCLTKTSRPSLLVICPYTDFGGMEADIIVMLDFNISFNIPDVPTSWNLSPHFTSSSRADQLRHDFVAVYTAITRAKSHVIILFKDFVFSKIQSFHPWLERNIFMAAQKIETNAKPDIQNIRRLQQFSHVIVRYRTFLNKIIPHLGDLIYAVYHPISGRWRSSKQIELLLVQTFRKLMPEKYEDDFFRLERTSTINETDGSIKDHLRETVRLNHNELSASITKEELLQWLQKLVTFCENVQIMKKARVLPSSIITEDKIETVLKKLQKECDNWVRERYPQYYENGQILPWTTNQN